MKEKIKKFKAGVVCHASLQTAQGQSPKVLRPAIYILYIIGLIVFCTIVCISPIICEAAVTGLASFYDHSSCRFNPYINCPMANGESIYDAEAKGENYAAMWDVPFGTRFRVVNQENGRSTIVTITDRGPARRLNRVIDLSQKAFNEIADLNKGVIIVTLEGLS